MPRKGQPRINFDWNAEAISLLGTDSDAKIAKRLGLSASGVGNKRLLMGIKAFVPTVSTKKGVARPNFDWTPDAIAMLGTAPDSTVGKALGLSFGAIALKRRKLGIQSFGPSNKTFQLPAALKRQLGKKSDRAIASQLGVSVTSISKRRTRLRIQASVQQGSLPESADSELGVETDTAIAKRYGVSIQCVNKRRKKLGIPRAPIVKKETQLPILPDELHAKLGRQPDETIAAESGYKVPIIRSIRYSLGIQPYLPIDLLPASARCELGQLPDSHLAKKLGIPAVKVSRIRICSGIDAFTGFTRRQRPTVPPQTWLAKMRRSLPGWVFEELGTVPDSALSKKSAVSIPLIKKLRILLGIKMFPKSTPLPVGAQAVLGRQTDLAIAAQFNVPVYIIRSARTRLKIPALSDSEAQRIRNEAWLKKAQQKIPPSVIEKMGMVGDRDLAIEAGVTSAMLRKARVLMGIAPFKYGNESSTGNRI
jgi:DNA-binding Lrp family transcriptional regulator